MRRADAYFVHVAMALVAVSGAVFAWMKYGMTTDDPFAVANHPLQPWFLDAHVVAAPASMFALGLIFRSHIWRKFRGTSRDRRKSGLALMSLVVPMVLSGYLLQVSAGETTREVMAVIHWISSAVFVIGYLVHQFSRRGTAAAA